ncbi:MAG: cysteine desulfurase/selenocysteine lyase [Patiriisocius sp.]|jgi:cysteine desulfurase/selenocysteine lyase
MDLKLVRNEFPILNQEVNAYPLVYLDNAATTQKPNLVIDAIDKYYKSYNSNVHRGVHHLSVTATNAMEASRVKCKSFINAKKIEEVIFTSGTTGSINLIANSYGRKVLGKGDEVILSSLEHHSNIVPWQLICEEKGATIKVIPINDDGELMLDEFEKILSSKTKIISINHVSNTLGTLNPVDKIIELAHEVGAKVVLDGAQAVAHIPVDVQALDCDFYCFSGHKLYGPTGIGILYGKENLLEEMPPFMGGGEMISCVTFEKTTYNSLPFKFEAGTPNISGIIGLGASIDFVNSYPWEEIQKHEEELLDYLTKSLLSIEGLKIYGTSINKVSVVSFLIGEIHPYDIGVLLDKMGIAVRTGNHCTEPLMDRLGISGTVRASLSIYNNIEDVDALVKGLKKVIPILV